MSLSDIKFPQENPFYQLKVHHLVLWFLIFYFGVIIQVSIIAVILQIKAIYTLATIAAVWIFTIFFCWIIKRCKTLGIEQKKLIGKVPRNYQWLPVIILIITQFLFTIGAYRLFYYCLSFFFPDLVLSIIVNNLNDVDNNYLVDFSFYSIPIILLDTIVLGIATIYFEYLVNGIVFHRWATKWSSKRVILLFGIFFAVTSYPNCIGGISYILIDTFLYLTSRTLIVPVIAHLLNYLLSIIWNHVYLFIYSRTINLEEFRSGVGTGIIFLVISVPYIVYFVAKNWHRLNEPLPYFTNQSR